MTQKLPIVLIAAADDEILTAVSHALPPERFAPLAARSWGSVAESLGVIPLAAAIVHYALEDAEAVGFCYGLRSLPKHANLPIVLLLPGLGRLPTPDEPFDAAIGFPVAPAVLLDNVVKVMAKHDERLLEAISNLKAEVAWRVGDIENKTYYEILEVTSSTGYDDIVKAYDRFSLRFHPDRLRLLPDDDDTRIMAKTFYVHVTEAYQVLTNARKRKVYDAGLAKGKFRFDPAVLATEKRNVIDHAELTSAKRYLRLAEQQLARGDRESAIMMARMALNAEPENRHIGRYVERLERES